ncbi:hypothetical protein Tco_0550382 [Tanacetum coccineum]
MGALRFMFSPDGGIYGLRFDVLKCTDRFFDHARSHLALPTVPIVALASGAGAGADTDGLHYPIVVLQGIVATWLTHTDLELTFIALGGVSITLLSKVYCILSRYCFLLRGITFVVVSETAKRISSKWSDTFLMEYVSVTCMVVVEMKNEYDMLKLRHYFFTAIKKWDCRSRAHSIPSLFYGRADFSSVRRLLFVIFAAAVGSWPLLKQCGFVESIKKCFELSFVEVKRMRELFEMGEVGVVLFGGGEGGEGGRP